MTGRALPTIKDFVKIPPSEDLNFLYAASHGFRIETGRVGVEFAVGKELVPQLKGVAAGLGKQLGDIPGFQIEDNEFSISVHYRFVVVCNNKEKSLINI